MTLNRRLKNELKKQLVCSSAKLYLVFVEISLRQMKLDEK